MRPVNPKQKSKKVGDRVDHVVGVVVTAGSLSIDKKWVLTGCSDVRQLPSSKSR